MSEEIKVLTQRQIRSPRSAAIAGILFALMQIASMILMSSIAVPADLSRELLETWSSTYSAVLVLVPFSGIAFLWFTGVVRDRIGDLEDRFFATIFLGSGILFVGLMFIWAATFGAILRSFAMVRTGLSLDKDVFIFGFAFMNEIIGSYLTRMAGVYMLSTGTIWIRSGVMPRWITIITFIVALGFLIFAGAIREARYIFPGWVLMVSVYILIMNYRRPTDQDSEDVPPLVD